MPNSIFLYFLFKIRENLTDIYINEFLKKKKILYKFSMLITYF